MAAEHSRLRRGARRGAHVPPAGSVARARLILVGALVAAVVVLAAWFPASALLHQRATLDSTAAQLAALRRQDAALAQEKKNLSAPGEIGRIAREQYQLVSPGQQSYEVLPRPGTAATGSDYAGDPGANGPVVPSATSELPPGATGGSATSTPAEPVADGRPPPAGAGAGAGGLLGRMLRTLEFWR